MTLKHTFVSAIADGADTSLVRPSDWNADHTVSGTSLQIQFNNAGALTGMAGTSWDDTNRSLTLTGATVTASNPVLNLSQTWNNAAVAFTALKLNITNTTSSSSSLLMDLQRGGTTQFNVNWLGGIVFSNAYILHGGANYWIAETPQGQVFQCALNDAFYINAPCIKLGASNDAILSRVAAATFQFGNADAAAPVAQTLRAQSVVAGTTDTVGTDLTFKASVGTGTGAGGKIILQTAPAGATGTSQNALATALTLTAPAVNMQPSVVVGNQALATNATDGFLYIPTCAGTPTGTPTAFTGRVAMIYDTTNNKFYVYNTAWKGGTNPGVFT